MWFKIRALTCISLVALCLRIGQAQVTSAGSIAGQVLDASGAMLPQATVLAIQAKTNVQWKTVTDATGAYVFPNLPVGSYTLSAQKVGFSVEQVKFLMRVPNIVKIDA